PLRIRRRATVASSRWEAATARKSSGTHEGESASETSFFFWFIQASYSSLNELSCARTSVRLPEDIVWRLRSAPASPGCARATRERGTNVDRTEAANVSCVLFQSAEHPWPIAKER